MTPISDKNIDQFAARLDGICQTLGNGATAKGLLVGVQLWDVRNATEPLFAGTNKGYPADLAGITEKFEAWDAADAGNFGIQVLVERLGVNRGLSGYVDVDAAVAFALAS